MYVRNLFAMIEGVVFGSKQVALEAANRFGVALSAAEFAVCREETYSVDERGRVSVRPLFPRATANLRFALSILPRAYKIDLRVDFDGKGWRALESANVIRNRLVHPKSVANLEVSENELATIHDAEAWFRQQFTAIARAIAKATE